jgi:hypothetical protein
VWRDEPNRRPSAEERERVLVVRATTPTEMEARVGQAVSPGEQEPSERLATSDVRARHHRRSHGLVGRAHPVVVDAHQLHPGHAARVSDDTVVDGTDQRSRRAGEIDASMAGRVRVDRRVVVVHDGRPRLERPGPRRVDRVRGKPDEGARDRGEERDEQGE